MSNTIRKIPLPYLIATILMCITLGCYPLSQRGSTSRSDFKDIARFLAGAELGRWSSLYSLTRNEYYASYREEIVSSWKNFQEPNLRAIESWADARLPKSASTIFYPFSGPDILNAVAFFPESETYILFGLEPLGGIPHPEKLSPRELRNALDGIKDSMINVLRWNFFKTKKMEKTIGNNHFNGVIGIMMFLLARYGYSVHDIRKIWIDSEGEISYRDKKIDPDMAIPGFELTFSRGSAFYQKKIHYFQLDVRNSSLRHHTNFIRYLKIQERLTTIIKAATYLMHFENHSFTIIRSLILSRSKLILQDDSGIPLDCFYDDDWELSFYGIYTRPIPLFDNRYQPELYRRIQKQSEGILPFTYGYYIDPGSAHLIIARRRNLN